MYGGNESLTDVELEDVRSLTDLFSDLEPAVVRAVYLQNDRDYKAAQQALADLAKNPSAKSQLLLQQLPVSTHQAQGRSSPMDNYNDGIRSQSHGAAGNDADMTGLAALALAPAPSDAPSSGSYLPALPAFDVNTLADTFSQVSNSMTEGIASFGWHLTNWVADIASAFDTGLGDEVEERHPQPFDKNEPSIGYGTGVGIERPYQRRLASVPSAERQVSNRLEADQEQVEEEDDWDDGDDGYGKDD